MSYGIPLHACDDQVHSCLVFLLCSVSCLPAGSQDQVPHVPSEYGAFRVSSSSNVWSSRGFNVVSMDTIGGYIYSFITHLHCIMRGSMVRRLCHSLLNMRVCRIVGADMAAALRIMIRGWAMSDGLRLQPRFGRQSYTQHHEPPNNALPPSHLCTLRCVCRSAGGQAAMRPVLPPTILRRPRRPRPPRTDWASSEDASGWTEVEVGAARGRRGSGPSMADMIDADRGSLCLCHSVRSLVRA